MTAKKWSGFPRNINRNAAIASKIILTNITLASCDLGRFFKSINNEFRKLRYVFLGLLSFNVAPPT